MSDLLLYTLSIFQLGRHIFREPMKLMLADPSSQARVQKEW